MLFHNYLIFLWIHIICDLFFLKFRTKNVRNPIAVARMSPASNLHLFHVNFRNPQLYFRILSLILEKHNCISENVNYLLNCLNVCLFPKIQLWFFYYSIRNSQIPQWEFSEIYLKFCEKNWKKGVNRVKIWNLNLFIF